MAVAAEYAFINTYRRLQAEPTADQRAQIAKQRAKQAQKLADAIAKHAETVRSIKEQITLLNWEMPNGKRLRNCTGAECVECGGWLAKVGKKVGTTKRVGEVLNEKEVRAILES